MYACCSKIWSRNSSKHGTSLQTLPAAWPQVFLGSALSLGLLSTPNSYQASLSCSVFMLKMYATTHMLALVLLLSQVRWRFGGPYKITAEILCYSIKWNAHLLCLSNPWSYVLWAPYCGINRPNVSQLGRLSPAAPGQGGLTQAVSFAVTSAAQTKVKLLASDYRLVVNAWKFVWYFKLEPTEFGEPGTDCSQAWHLITFQWQGWLEKTKMRMSQNYLNAKYSECWRICLGDRQIAEETFKKQGKQGL